MGKTIKIEGMSCGHCVKAVEKALGVLEGVSAVSVDLEKKQAVVTLSGKSVSDSVLKEALEDAGYEVLGIV